MLPLITLRFKTKHQKTLVLDVEKYLTCDDTQGQEICSALFLIFTKNFCN